MRCAHRAAALVVCGMVCFGQEAEAQLPAADRAARLTAQADSAFATGNGEASSWAIARWQEAAALFMQAGEAARASQAWRLAGRAQYGLGRFAQALASFHSALEIDRARKDPTLEAGGLVNIANMQRMLGQSDSARRYFNEAQVLAERLGDPSIKTMAYNGIANFYMNLAPDSALFYLRPALSAARLGSDRLVEAGTLTNIGLVFDRLAQLDSALAYGHLALALARQLGSSTTEASSLQNLSNTYRRIGKTDSSVVYLRMALPIRKRLGDRNNEARIYGALGIAFNDRGMRDSAMLQLRSAAAIQRAIGDRPGLAQATHVMAMVQQELGLSDSALVYNREALMLRRQIADRRGEGATLNNMVIVFTDLGQLDSALAYGRLARAARRETRDRQGEGQTLDAMGVVYSRLAHQDSALVMFREALAISRETGNRLVEAGHLKNIGQTFGLLQQIDSAFGYLSAGRAIARELKNYGIEATAVQDLARAYALSGNLTSARAAYDTAAAIQSTLRRQAGHDLARTSLAELSTDLYEQWALAWANEQNGRSQPLAALAAAERGRAQALLDLMRDTTTAVLAGSDLAAEGARLVGAVTRSGAAGLFYLATKDTLLVWVAAPSGKATLLRHAIARDSVTAQVGRLREALGSSAAEAILATRGAALEAAGLGLGLRAAGDNAWKREAQELARLLLLDRALDYLGNTREVVIVAQGALAVIPFALLPAGTSAQPFGVQHALRYSPSLATLHQAELRAAPRVQMARTSLALVVGNPAMPEVTVASGERSRLSPLPGAEAESQTVANQLGARPLNGALATESEVRRRLPTAPVVHLASHGFVYSAADMTRQSFVALAADSVHDGALTVGEILDDDALRLTADLVALSACQTGLGNLKQAEGTVGLQRALLARGARSVLVSLWSVSDDATRRLMESFYRHWLADPRRPSKAEALRLAQEELRKTSGFEHPRFWAGFQLVGAR